MELNFIKNESIILEKLDIFIRKYYKNRILQGCLIFLALSVAGFLLIIFSEYLFHFGQVMRSILFFTLIICGFALLTWLLAIPMLKLMRVGKVMSHQQAARIIGDHFPEIGDKLSNTLQLIDQRHSQKENFDLLIAGIDQKINTLRIYKFTQIINFKKNIKYLKYVIPPVILLIFILLVSPSMISDPVTRIVKFSEGYVEPLPYQIIILNENFTALQQEDYELRIKMLGDEIPNEIYIKNEHNTFQMIKEKSRIFSYTFKSLQNNVIFSIIAGKAETKNYEIEVFPRPTVLDFKIILTFPEYINKEPQIVQNTGDFTVPEGTIAKWEINTKDVEKIKMEFDDKEDILLQKNNNVFVNSKRITKSGKYSISTSNVYTTKSDILSYRIEVINDGYPSISVTEMYDSSLLMNIFTEGIIKDDYGFSKLLFKYEVLAQTRDIKSPIKEIPVAFEKNNNNQLFYYSINPSALQLAPGMNYNYYFEVWDNDAINGPKSTKTEIKTIKIPTIQEVAEQVKNNATGIESDMENSLKESKSISKNMEDLKRKLVDQNELNWIEKQKIESQMNTLEKISKDIEKIQKLNNENIEKEENLLNTNQRIIEKQKKLNELMEQILSEDLKSMIKELKDLLKEADKAKIEEILEKMKLSTKDIEKQLDNNLQLFKQIEFERKLSEQITDLRKLANEQKNLAEKTQNNEHIQDQLTKSQDSIKKVFDSISKNLEELSKSEEELEIPVNIKETSNDQKEIQSLIEESKNELQKRNNRKASQNQKNTERKMNNLAENLEKMQNNSEAEQLEEDANNVRFILENLIRLSFQQENLINRTKITNKSDPKFPEIVNEQLEIGERLKVSEDSLNEIAKRQVFVRPVITKELGKIKQNIRKSVDLLNNRSLAEAISKEQFIMTSVNNLALLLSETLDQMNQEMNSMNGNGQKACKNPSKKGGKASIKGMKEMQEKLGKELEKMKNSLEKMRSQGQGGKQEQGQYNKELAKMAAQQEAIRNELQKYKESLIESGNNQGLKDGDNISKAIEEMEKNEREIINKQITQESLNRQQKILTRMLESEKAEQQREKEEKRESIEAKNQNYSNPNTDLKYKIKTKQDTEILKITPLPLNHFYKAKMNSYILTLDK